MPKHATETKSKNDGLAVTDKSPKPEKEKQKQKQKMLMDSNDNKPNGTPTRNNSRVNLKTMYGRVRYGGPTTRVQSELATLKVDVGESVLVRVAAEEMEVAHVHRVRTGEGSAKTAIACNDPDGGDACILCCTGNTPQREVLILVYDYTTDGLAVFRGSEPTGPHSQGKVAQLLRAVEGDWESKIVEVRRPGFGRYEVDEVADAKEDDAANDEISAAQIDMANGEIDLSSVVPSKSNATVLRFHPHLRRTLEIKGIDVDALLK